MHEYLVILIDTFFSLFALFIVTKLLGKTRISQLTPFDFISAVLLGDLVGGAVLDEKIGVMKIAYVVIVYGLIIYAAEVATEKFKRTRDFFEGSPAIVIHSGQLIRDTMKKNRLDINQLQHMLRDKDVFSIDQVQFAILEANGNLSVLKKSAYEAPNRKDIGIDIGENTLATTLINDGELIYDNLKEMKVSEDWLKDELYRLGYDSFKDVFYAECKPNKELFALPYYNRNHRKYK